MLLDAWQLGDEIYIKQVMRLGSGSLLSKREKYEGFLSSTFHYVETEGYFMVHAGFDFTHTNPFLDIERMLMIREVKYDAAKARDKTVIRGHLPCPISRIREELEKRDKVISLDNGCVYPEKEGMGKLLALELNSGKLIEQENID